MHQRLWVSRAFKVAIDQNSILLYVILKIIFKIKLLFVTFIQPDVSPQTSRGNSFPAARSEYPFLDILWIFNALSS